MDITNRDLDITLKLQVEALDLELDTKTGDTTATITSLGQNTAVSITALSTLINDKSPQPRRESEQQHHGDSCVEPDHVQQSNIAHGTGKPQDERG